MPSFQFLGAVTDVTPHPAGVECRAGTPRVRVEALAPGLFRVRCAPDGGPLDASPHSYAVDPDFAPDPPACTVETGDTAIRLQAGDHAAVIERAPCRLRFEDAAGRPFAADAQGMGWQGTAAHSPVTVWKKKAEGARFYGLGEKAARLDRTGLAFENWNSDTPNYQWNADDTPERTDPLYKTIPFYIGLRPNSSDDAPGARYAYGVFFDNTYRSQFDFGGQSAEHVHFGADGGPLTYYVCAGPTMADVLRRYTQLTGRMPRPPRWALGYHQCRWSYYPESEVRTLARQFRERDLPLDVIHLDIHYMDDYRVFTWDEDRFPNPEQLARDLKADGIRLVTIVDPGVGVDPGYHVHDSGLDADAFVQYPDGTLYVGEVWPGDCYFPDFTDPDTRTWWGDQYEALLDAGIAGFWNDMNEPSVFGGKTMPDLLEFDFDGAGATHRAAHNVYGQQMARATCEGLRRHRPDERPFVITRAAYAGVQRYASVWTGDNAASWDHLRLTPSMLLSLGLSGVPFAGSDVGGFEGAPSPELYARWIQLGALSPLFRSHTIYESPRQEPWSFGPRTEQVARQALQLRYRLIPYFETLMDEHARTGLPPLRPLVMHYPDDDRLLDVFDQFLVGRDVLAAPVLRQGAETRAVRLPEGTWHDLQTGQAHAGPGRLTVDVTLEDLPLFVRAGTALPLAPAVSHTDALDAVETLELRCFPGTGTATLYQDDGHSTADANDAFRRTTFGLSDEDNTFAIERAAEGSFDPPTQRFELRVMDVDRAPTRLTVDGDDVPVAVGTEASGEAATYDPGARTLTAVVAADFDRVVVERG